MSLMQREHAVILTKISEFLGVGLGTSWISSGLLYWNGISNRAWWCCAVNCGQLNTQTSGTTTDLMFLPISPIFAGSVMLRGVIDYNKAGSTSRIRGKEYSEELHSSWYGRVARFYSIA